mmetsp:Transcript_64731/g.150509  ORF Transcript_64731/g.150509 Transcript_64731/m.150509 type:complete len:144 (+) Transcript_64731:71-502(+)
MLSATISSFALAAKAGRQEAKRESKGAKSARSVSRSQRQKECGRLTRLPELRVVDVAGQLEARGYNVRHVVVERWPFGIDLRTDDKTGECQVSRVLAKSLAESRGVLPGDYILPFAGLALSASGFALKLQEQPTPFTLSFLRL